MTDKAPMSALFANMRRDIRLKGEGLASGVKKIIREESEDAAERMRHYISTRPVPGSGKEGRIKTGDMLRSVDFELENFKTIARGRVGYMHNPKEYMRMQEEGYVDVVHGNKEIPGTYALHDASREMAEIVNDRLQSELGLRGPANVSTQGGIVL